MEGLGNPLLMEEVVQRFVGDKIPLASGPHTYGADVLLQAHRGTPNNGESEASYRGGDSAAGSHTRTNLSPGPRKALGAESCAITRSSRPFIFYPTHAFLAHPVVSWLHC